MAKLTRLLLVAATLIATALASYVGGVLVGRAQAKSGFNQALASVQLELGQTRLERLQELESDLTRSCNDVALTKVRIDTQVQMAVLSGIYKEHKGTWVVEGIARRDPTLPVKLAEFQLTSNSWPVPKC
jgi:hypothetical protein